MNADELRKSFLDFFADRGHRVVASSSLIPEDDPSLLFTGAGMNQFKSFLLGKEKNDFLRAASCQKCFRTTDIENIGHTVRHLTFLEMLGNFSFGDYFKDEAIVWAWEFTTSVLRLPRERLWISVFKEDDEAYLLWKKIGFPTARIVRLGEEDNFWSMGSTGPCGPCSEIIFDRGEKKGCGQKNCGPGCNCDRFLELWNLVFTQFNRTSNGDLMPLPQKNIDTGMGLERALFLLEGGETVLECSLLKPILNSIAETLELSNRAGGTALWIMADHLRAATFLTGDGVLPTNDGRGYVLRRLLRRAVRQAYLLLGQKKLSLDKPFLYTSVPIVTNLMKSAYPELTSRREHITQVVFSEEERFLRTLEQGMEILVKVINESKKGKKNEIPAEMAFKMHDTYGFPIDLTEEIASENGLTINRNEFSEQVRKQQERARLDRESKITKILTGDIGPSGKVGIGKDEEKIFDKIPRTEFVGYETLEHSVKVLAIIKEGKLISSTLKGDRIEIILDKTPFYPESGGQAGDTGLLCKDETKIEIVGTRESSKKGVIIHQGIVVQGKIGLQEQLDALVDSQARQATACNHTATHLLQNVLRHILSEHITQLGSSVSPERLRFDFSHFKKIDDRELTHIEEMVNEKIRENKEVVTYYTTLEKAKAMGAIALFEEKYEESVRLVKIGNYSCELCGGTHVKATGEIGIFHILSESSIAAGVRRIEAVSAKAAWQTLKGESQLLTEVGQMLKSPSMEVRDKVESLLKQIRTLEKEVNLSRKKEMGKEVEKLLREEKTVSDIKIISSQLKGAAPEELRSMADILREKIDSGVIVLGSETRGKVFLVARVTEDLIKRGFHAGNIIKEVAGIVGGSGGGRPDYAQAGGKNAARLSDALLKVPQIVASHRKATSC